MVLANTDVTMALVSYDRINRGDRGGFNAGGDASLVLLNARGIAGGFVIILMLLMGVSAQQL